MSQPIYVLQMQESLPTPSGERGFAWCAKLGLLFVDVPRRRKPFVCPAGVTHLRYWRSHGNAGPDREHYACEHNSQLV